MTRSDCPSSLARAIDAASAPTPPVAARRIALAASSVVTARASRAVTSCRRAARRSARCSASNRRASSSASPASSASACTNRSSSDENDRSRSNPRPMTPMREVPAEIGVAARARTGWPSSSGSGASPRSPNPWTSTASPDRNASAIGPAPAEGHGPRPLTRHAERGDHLQAAPVGRGEADHAGDRAERLSGLRQHRVRDLLDTEIRTHRAGDCLDPVDPRRETQRFLARLLEQRTLERLGHLGRDRLELGPLELIERPRLAVAHEQDAHDVAGGLERDVGPRAIAHVYRARRVVRVAPVELLGRRQQDGLLPLHRVGPRRGCVEPDAFERRTRMVRPAPLGRDHLDGAPVGGDRADRRLAAPEDRDGRERGHVRDLPRRRGRRQRRRELAELGRAFASSALGLEQPRAFDRLAALAPDREQEGLVLEREAFGRAEVHAEDAEQLVAGQQRGGRLGPHREVAADRRQQRVPLERLLRARDGHDRTLRDHVPRDDRRIGGEARPRREQLLVEPACRHPLELGTVGRQERHGRRVGAERPDRGVDERPADVADGERVRKSAGQVVQVRETGRFGFGGLTRPSFRRVGDVAFVRGLSVPVGDGSREPGGHGPQDDRDPTAQLAVGDEQDEPSAARQRDEDPRQRSRQDAGEDREQEPEAARNASVRALGGPGERDGDGDLHRSPQEQGRREGHGAPAGPTGSHGLSHCTRRPPMGRTLSMWRVWPCRRRPRSTRFPSLADPQG